MAAPTVSDLIRARAAIALERCDQLARCTDDENPARITRTFLSPASAEVHKLVAEWMQQAGLSPRTDAAGNLIGESPAPTRGQVLCLGSHLDTVPNAGRYDGILGVLLGIAVVECLREARLPFGFEIVGFSEEEGVRFGFPYIGSRAWVGTMPPEWLDRKDRDDITVREAIRAFGLDPSPLGPPAPSTPDAPTAVTPAGNPLRPRHRRVGFLEVHIEQGPVLERLEMPLGIVGAIAGQTRMRLAFTGKANHAGTTPMDLRADALAAAAQWILDVQATGRRTPNLRATVGAVKVDPGARNVVPGVAEVSLDVRHSDDSIRRRAVDYLLQSAREIAAHATAQSGGGTIGFEVRVKDEDSAVPMDRDWVDGLAFAVGDCGYPGHIMVSGAGHDIAMIAPHMPATMLFVRSPGGISHHPDEAVIASDVTAALHSAVHFVETLSARGLVF